MAVNALTQVVRHPERELLAEVRNELVLAETNPSYGPTEYKYWNQFPFTLGLLRESLRQVPPGAGVPRYGNFEFELAGYRIPAKTPIMMEPRIGNNDPNLFPEPNQFEPLRWVPVDNPSAKASNCPFAGSALNRGVGSWLPGGFGAHQCPGIPIAELAGKMVVAKMASRFETWEYSGDGLTKNGEIKYVQLPIQCPVDDFGIYFKPIQA